MWIKLLIIVALLVIFFTLASALLFLVRKKDPDQNVAKALSWRIGLSVLLFVFLFVAFSQGWIAPHGISG